MTSSEILAFLSKYNQKSHFEVIELEPDFFTNYDALAMCSDELSISKIFAGDMDVLRSANVPTEVIQISTSQFQLNTEDIAIYSELFASTVLERRVPRRVLILGGGDGVIAGDILKNKLVEEITLVDSNKAITDAWSKGALGIELNHNSLNNERLNIVTASAKDWIRENTAKFEAIVMDLRCDRLLQDKSFIASLDKSLESNSIIACQCIFPAGEGLNDVSLVKDALTAIGLIPSVLPVELKSLGNSIAGYIVHAMRET